MKRYFSVALALCFALAWGVALVAFPLFLETFSDFKVEMPPLTRAMIALDRVGFWFILGGAALWTAVLLAMLFRIGWWLAMGLNALLDLYLLGLLMPIIALINGLAGDEPTGFLLSAFRPGMELDPTLYPKVWLVAAGLNQLVKIALVPSRCAFSR